MKLPLIILTPLSLLLVIFLLSNQAVPIVYAQPTGWVELVEERTRTGKSFFDPSHPGAGLLKIDVAKVHYDGPDWKDIDNTLVPSLANVPTLGLVDLEMTTDDYEFYALQTLNTIPLWFYRNKSAPDIYITFMPQGIQWTNDLDQIDQISMPQSVIGTVTDNHLHWENAYGQGINLTLSFSDVCPYPSCALSSMTLNMSYSLTTTSLGKFWTVPNKNDILFARFYNTGF